jgi:predicted small integral membrane protein
MIIRISKLVLIFSFSFYLLLVVFNNITDYNSNFQFVRHVLMMDTTFPGNNGMWRAVNSEILHHVFYSAIIITESAASLFGFIGCFKMFNTLKSDTASFNDSKKPAVISLLISFVLWFIGFIVIGGEWFLMWQSDKWNGINAAFRITVIVLLILLFILKKDE